MKVVPSDPQGSVPWRVRQLNVRIIEAISKESGHGTELTWQRKLRRGPCDFAKLKAEGTLSLTSQP